jgi:diaminopimelate decarboxylase
MFNECTFSYKNNELYAENVPVKDIIKETSTPVYIYST